MRAVCQRVTGASVVVDGDEVGRIGTGLVVLVGVATTDTVADAEAMAAKLVGLRVFRDDERGFERSLLEVGGSMLAISQFTLFGDVRRGRRPSFTEAAAGPAAEPVYEAFVAAVEARGVFVATGVFGAMMEVALTNDGPVTLVVEVVDGRVR
jgi:D-tyrosyl-tRNA(Tyr) deacylase